MFRFHKWRIYQSARLFRKEIRQNILPLFPSEERFVLCDQLLRAATSISLNIAEGSFRRSQKDLARFMNQALSSLYEVVSCFDLALDSGYLKQEQANEYTEKAESLARQLVAFTKTLQ